MHSVLDIRSCYHNVGLGLSLAWWCVLFYTLEEPALPANKSGWRVGPWLPKWLNTALGQGDDQLSSKAPAAKSEEDQSGAGSSLRGEQDLLPCIPAEAATRSLTVQPPGQDAPQSGPIFLGEPPPGNLGTGAADDFESWTFHYLVNGRRWPHDDDDVRQPCSSQPSETPGLLCQPETSPLVHHPAPPKTFAAKAAAPAGDGSAEHHPGLGGQHPPKGGDMGQVHGVLDSQVDTEIQVFACHFRQRGGVWVLSTQAYFNMSYTVVTAVTVT